MGFLFQGYRCWKNVFLMGIKVKTNRNSRRANNSAEWDVYLREKESKAEMIRN